LLHIRNASQSKEKQLEVKGWKKMFQENGWISKASRSSYNHLTKQTSNKNWSDKNG
jgi:hypothetical protein